MRNEVKISVVMPVYNSEKYLKESIESILNQTYENFEFIIINDGSNDDSLRIISEYSKVDSRIRVISRENRGIVKTLNEGITLSKGEYIARMDADDISNPKRFEVQVEFMEKNKDYGVASTFINIFGNAYDERINNEIENCHNKENIQMMDLLCSQFVICHPTVIVRKQVFDLYGLYNEEYKYCEDLELWLRLLKNGVKIKNIPQRLLNYRKDISSKTYQTKNEYAIDIIKMRLGILNELIDIDTKKFKYFIWGASNGGKMCLEKCNEIFKNGECLGYIDLYKKGTFNDKKIYFVDELEKQKYDYVFVASAPGLSYALIYLSNLRKTIIKDFINVF
ncbi:glycosyltransferase [Clostridium beijerinckii]|uniref:glycosyltransferase n=1 Tax=Clostridium beijerinckii TaxID=1520 RepID=UPI001570D499|nr:glycosyltransferase [Clostridium beijerinckii]NRT73686.1 glycosyltransferase involved in cell wall biosynthesis [Clostridium beijerinckii]